MYVISLVIFLTNIATWHTMSLNLKGGLTMFFKRKMEETAVLGFAQEVSLTPPVGQRVEKSDFAGVELKEYAAIAEKIGFTNGALLEAQLRDFFAEEGICLYDYSKVSLFLAEKAKHEGPALIWCWKPLRKGDCGELASNVTWETNGYISKSQYHGAVPYPVLLTVEKIAQRFGEQVHFFVSDYKAKDPDPFLAVTGVGIEWFVVERWDEPNFRT